MTIEIVDLPIDSMVDSSNMSIVFCQRLPEGIKLTKPLLTPL